MRLATWARWVLPFGIAAALVVGLVLYVDHHNSDGLAPQNPAALARANREAEIVVAQDQAPHVIRLRSAANPGAAFAHAVRAEVNGLVNRGIIDGTLQHVACARHGGRGDTLGFSCRAVVAGVNYPFVGVVHVAARQLVYCKRDEPPVPSQNIPISPRCEA